MGEIRRFLRFYVKISQNWLKFLGFPQNFGVLYLKMQKFYKKIDFYETFASFVVKNALNAIFGPNK